MIETLLLLGATGDLARRFLFPALQALAEAGRLPDGFRVIGGARNALADEEFRTLMGDALPAHMVSYRQVDLADAQNLAAALGPATGPVAVYLALPPAVIGTTIESLRAVGLPAGSRIAVEKPFGADLESARALNALLAQACEDAYRIDHVLAMETTRNLVAIRRANTVVDQVWNGERVELVEILWEETLALEGRAGYYDHAGALKDVLQNHMLQLLACVAMDPPDDEHDEHTRKLDVLRSVHAVTCGLRARYAAGTLADGRSVGAYAHEQGVDPARETETFVEVEVEIPTPRWRDTRFVLRAGKALARRQKLVRVRFRDGSEFEAGIDGPTDLVLRLHDVHPEPLELRGSAPEDALPPYAHLLLDVISQTNTLSVSSEESEEAWRIVTPVLHAWSSGAVPLAEYVAGATGPSR